MNWDRSRYMVLPDIDLLAILGYREAEGETNMGRRAVMWTAQNRVFYGGWYSKPIIGTFLQSVILKPYQYSSFNPDSPRAGIFPNWNLPIWQNLRLMASDIINGKDTDPTAGADYVHALPHILAPGEPDPCFPATWGDKSNFAFTLTTGKQIFYKYKPILSNHDDVSNAALGAN